MPDFGASLAFGLIGALGITGGAAVTAIVTTGVLLGYAAPVALGLGVTAYQQHAMRRAMQEMRAVNDNNGLQQILKQAIPPQRLLLGRATVGGALFFYEAKKPYLWMGILLAAHEVDGFENLLINGNTVFIGPDGFATSVPFKDGANTYIEVSFRNGSIDQAIDPIIARDFPSMPTTFRQRGHATLVIKAHYGYGSNAQAQDDDHRRVYGDQGALQPIIRMRAARCFDPRRAGAVADDPSTWAWSQNAAICLGRFLTHRWVSNPLIDPARLDWDRIAAAADICDRWEASKDGTTLRRSTVDGVVQSSDPNYDVIENMLVAMEGKLVLNRGRIYPVVDIRKEPVATLHMGMLTGSLEYTAEPRDRELVNIVKPTFISPDREYQEVAGPVLRRGDLVAADGIPRERSLRGAFVEDHRRIQRKASTFLKQSRLGRTISASVTDEALREAWEPGAVIRVHLTGVLARANGLYEVAGMEWDERVSGFQIALIEYDPTATDFDPEDEQDFTLDEDVLEAEAA